VRRDGERRGVEEVGEEEGGSTFTCRALLCYIDSN